ncbi:DUF3857 domain-containing protein [Tenacibaculum maritimum]|uniref:DUF3857 domain-containing protein n=1 Tax=Tenacibaculum maritimum TaxID=107401 RepID=UPI0012E44D6E|nr:DUF3857 domain-containing protein [Tenacibaculum maritimum]CAA0248739.1 conserved hypothetical protein [Tenacibaculum maritimum]
MKKKILIACLFIGFIKIGTCQKKNSTKIGRVSKKDLEITSYEKDTTANAFVLLEHSNTYIDEKNNYNFVSDYYFKKKLLTKAASDISIVSILLYKKEKINQIEGITYNLNNGNIDKTVLSPKSIFEKQINENWKEVTFTLPNIKEGSVIEYVYSISSPYQRLPEWNFQSDIPKVKSRYTSSILGNWKYNIRIIGNLKLDIDNPTIKKNCVYVAGIGNGHCSNLEYEMNDIPAFKEEEYMLSKKNFISRLCFDLISFTQVDGRIKKYTKTWKDADKALKNNFLDRQSLKKSYFKNNIPSEILAESDNLKRTKKIYHFIQNHFTWNEKYWPSRKIKLKKAFQEKIGNIFDINLSLFNSLKAANINCKLILASTRSKGLLTKLYPIYDEFNYLIVKAFINDKEYLLDATNKNFPFGLIRFEALNEYGRLMDFKKGSSWIPLSPAIISKKRTMVTLKLEEGFFKGTINRSKSGYYTVEKRNELKTINENSYLENFESKFPHIEVENYTHKNLYDLDKSLRENFEVNIDFENTDQNNKLRIFPFFLEKQNKNPFKLKERNYPVNFGFSRNSSYLLSLEIPKGYKVSKLPKSKKLNLPNNGGTFIYQMNSSGNTIMLIFKFILHKKRFSNNEYFYLKEFYKQLIDKQNEYIELERI